EEDRKALRPGRPLDRRRLDSVRRRDVDHELAPGSGTLARRIEPTAVHLDQTAREMEADAKPDAGRVRRRSRLRVEIEHPGEGLGTHAHAVIAHPDGDPCILAFD